jgi:hypothetical protein
MAIVRLLPAVTLEHKLVTGRVKNPISQVSGVGNRKSLCDCRLAAAILFASDVKFGRLAIHHHASTVAGLERIQHYADRCSDPRFVCAVLTRQQPVVRLPPPPTPNLVYCHNAQKLEQFHVCFSCVEFDHCAVHIHCKILTLSLLMSYIYGAPSKARNLTSYIYMDEILYWGFCFLNRAFR